MDALLNRLYSILAKSHVQASLRVEKIADCHNMMLQSPRQYSLMRYTIFSMVLISRGFDITPLIKG